MAIGRVGVLVIAHLQSRREGFQNGEERLLELKLLVGSIDDIGQSLSGTLGLAAGLAGLDAEAPPSFGLGGSEGIGDGFSSTLDTDGVLKVRGGLSATLLELGKG